MSNKTLPLNHHKLTPHHHQTGPYSQFRVGAALLIHPSASSTTNSGPEIILGANVENAAYPVGTCAERVAVGTAVTTHGYGRGSIKAVGVATDLADAFCSPCGMCRQFLREFLEVSFACPPPSPPPGERGGRWQKADGE